MGVEELDPAGAVEGAQDALEQHGAVDPPLQRVDACASAPAPQRPPFLSIRAVQWFSGASAPFVESVDKAARKFRERTQEIVRTTK